MLSKIDIFSGSKKHFDILHSQWVSFAFHFWSHLKIKGIPEKIVNPDNLNFSHEICNYFFGDLCRVCVFKMNIDAKFVTNKNYTGTYYRWGSI